MPAEITRAQRIAQNEVVRLHGVLQRREAKVADARRKLKAAMERSDRAEGKHDRA